MIFGANILRLLLLVLALIATPVLANGGASASIQISVQVPEQPVSMQLAASNDPCARLLEEDPGAYLASNCAVLIANHQVSQPQPDLLLVEPI